MSTKTFVTYVSDGSTTIYTFPFEYLRTEFVKVLVEGQAVAFSLSNTYEVTLDAAVENGKVITIKRETATEELVDFIDGSILLANDLNVAALQSLHIAAEALDAAGSSLVLKEDGSYSAGFRRLSDLGDPVDEQDGVNKRWAETAMTSQLVLATTKASEASASASAAATSETNAASSESSASTDATTATTKAAEAAASAAAASTSETNAANSETSAAADAATATTKAAEAATSAANAQTWNPANYAELSGATFGGLVEVNRESFTMFRLRRDLSNGYRVDFNMDAPGEQFSFRLNGSTANDYTFEPGLLSTPSYPSSVLTKRMGDNLYLPKPGTVRCVQEDVLSDDTTYSTGSQSYVEFKEYLIEETAPDSKLIAVFSCYISPTGGDNGDAGQDNEIYCSDAAGLAQTIDGQLLRFAASFLKTSNSTSNSNSMYGTWTGYLPTLPQSAKIDLTPYGGSGMGWRIKCKQSENYNCTARTNQLRLHIRELAND